jgi:O-antigen/teichoic acid export membrane protein
MIHARSSLVHRVLRSSSILVVGFIASQGLRLASNLILTRILFPEAFGMMALITVVLIGVAMLSDIGTSQSIMQSQRGDDPSFLDTAWTLQIIRGVVLWLATLALTPAVASFYGEPDLLSYLPVVAFNLVIGGFKPTRMETANRHMQAGRLTILDLCAQFVGVTLGVLLALALRDVWALVISAVAGAAVHLVLMHAFLPGHRNQLRWEREAVWELIHFGKWIFLATLSGFIVGQADKILLGRYLDLDHFGIYNISYFLASVPLLLGGAVLQRVLIPTYRTSPPAASAANRAVIRKLRTGALAALLLVTAVLALGGPWLVRALFDSRYYEGQGIVVLIAIAQIPSLIIMTCDQAALAMGDSRRYFWFLSVRAVLTTAGLGFGIVTGGLAAAIIWQSIATVAVYPLLAWLLRPHGAWDPGLDARVFGISVALAAAALWVNQDVVALLP